MTKATLVLAGLGFAALGALTGCTSGKPKPLPVIHLEAPRTGKNFPTRGVQVGHVKVTPELGLKTGFTIAGTADSAVLLGDIPLLESEVSPVLRRILELGDKLEVTSLHNMFVGATPAVMSLHLTGHGKREKLETSARDLLAFLEQGKYKLDPLPRAAIDPARSALDPSAVSSKLFWGGELKNGVYRVTSPYGTRMNGQDLGREAGMGTWATFAGSNALAVMNGELASVDYEVNDVLHALLDGHVHIVSIHARMATETPRLIFIHFWGIGRFSDLAQTLRDALEMEKNFRGST